jgi:DNA-binding transcriptional LysR family regulator
MDKTITYILEVAKCGGITKAAKNLYITPSALSKFVQAKEDELQVKLFLRDGKKFVLTYAGERYVEMLRKMADYKKEMDDEMAKLSSIYMGRLRIGVQMSMIETLIADILPAFHETHPNVQITLEEHGMLKMLDALRRNELDVILGLTASREPDFEYRDILADQVVLVAPQGSGLEHAAIPREGFLYPWLPAETYAAKEVVMYAEGEMFRNYAERNYSNYGIKLQTSVTAKTTRTVLLCVENHMGIAFTSELLIHQSKKGESLERYSFGEHPSALSLAVVCAKNNLLAEEISDFTKIVRTYIN